MSGIMFELWVEGFDGSMDLFDRFFDYEEAQHEGMEVMNKYREARAWHVTVMGQEKPKSLSPIPSSLENWYEFNDRIPA